MEVTEVEDEDKTDVNIEERLGNFTWEELPTFKFPPEALKAKEKGVWFFDPDDKKRKEPKYVELGPFPPPPTREIIPIYDFGLGLEEIGIKVGNPQILSKYSDLHHPNIASLKADMVDSHGNYFAVFGTKLGKSFSEWVEENSMPGMVGNVLNQIGEATDYLRENLRNENGDLVGMETINPKNIRINIDQNNSPVVKIIPYSF